MDAPNNDLTTLYTDGITGWAKATNYSSSGNISLEEEAYLQGANCVSVNISANKTGVSSGISFSFTDPTGFTDGTDVFFMWWLFLFPNSIEDYNETVNQTAPVSNNTNGASGFFIGIGSTATDHDWYAVGGADYGRYPYGGWQNVAIDPQRDASWSDGPPTAGTYTDIAFLPNVVSAPSRGQSLVADAIRWGRGEITLTGTTGPAGTFDSVALANDSVNARFGLFQNQGGSYLWKGKMTFGTASSALTFDDQNVNIQIDDTRQVYAGFNEFEINNASTSVTWNNITISKVKYLESLDFDSSKGILTVNDGATFTCNNSTFIDMDRFFLDSNCTMTGDTWRRCNAVLQGGATFSGGTLENTTDSAALIIADSAGLGLNVLTTSFVRETGNTSHAVKVTDIVVGDISRDWNNTFTGYTGGTAGTVSGPSGVDSAVLEVNVASGSELTLNISPTADIPSVQNLGSGDVTVVAAVTVTLTGIKDNTEARIFNTGTTTELAGVESLSGGVGTGINNGTAGGSTNDNSFAFSTTVGTGLDIRLINIADWVHDDIINYIVPSGGGTVPISSRPERVYRDPD